MKRLVRVVVLLGAMAAIPRIQARIDEREAHSFEHAPMLYFNSGENLRKLVPGFEDLLADIYWLRTVQYFGRQRLYAKNASFELLLPLIEITVALDSRLEIAYRYGAIFLCEPYPSGRGDCYAGIRLLERGAAAMQDSWRLRQDLGFFHYLYLGNAKRASAILYGASRLRNAPFWLASMAASIALKGQDREISRRLWNEMLEQAEDEYIRNNALYHVQQIDGLDAIDRLDSAALKLFRLHGRRPTFEELLASGLVGRRDLTDSTGRAFAYDASKGRFWFERRSRLWLPRTR
jgi:hypothetical protein